LGYHIFWTKISAGKFWGKKLLHLQTIRCIQIYAAFSRKEKKSKTPENISDVCLSVRMQQLENHLTDVHEILYWRVLLKYVDIFQVWF
jgi:hypothetical protein